jgi:hypothetical protein
MLRDQLTESEPLLEFTHQDQAAVGPNARTLEADLDRGIEEKLKRPVLYLTHWVLTSGTSLPRSHPHKH